MSRGTILAQCWLLLCCVAVSLQLSITVFEAPAAVQSGEDVELKCSYDLGDEKTEELFVKWWLIPLHSDNRTQLYQRIAGSPGIAIRHNIVLKKDEEDTIVLSNVTPVDSGTYECEVSNIGGVRKDKEMAVSKDTIVLPNVTPAPVDSGTYQSEVTNIGEVRKHKEMIVFTEGTGPLLNVTTVPDGPDEDEKEDVLIKCEASEVAPKPEFIITVNGQEVVNTTMFISGPDERGLYEIFGNVTISEEDADGADVRCELVYENPTVTHQQYLAALVYEPTGAGFTTKAKEDTAQLETTPKSLQDESHSCQTKASWIILAVAPVIAHLTSLV